MFFKNRNQRLTDALHRLAVSLDAASDARHFQLKEFNRIMSQFLDDLRAALTKVSPGVSQNELDEVHASVETEISGLNSQIATLSKALQDDKDADEVLASRTTDLETGLTEFIQKLQAGDAPGALATAQSLVQPAPDSDAATT